MWDTTDTPPSTSHVGSTSHAISGKLSSKDPFPLVGISNDRRSAMAWSEPITIGLPRISVCLNSEKGPRQVPGETRTDYPSLCVTSKNKGEYVLQRSRL